MKWDEMTERDRDWLVAQSVLGIEDVASWEHERTLYGSGCYTTDISEAWNVAEWAISEGWLPSVEYFEKAIHKGYEVTLGNVIYDALWAIAPTAPEAICKVALKAVGVDIE